MKKFLAIYMGTDAKRDAWNKLEPAERERREKEAFDARRRLRPSPPRR